MPDAATVAVSAHERDERADAGTGGAVRSTMVDLSRRVLVIGIAVGIPTMLVVGAARGDDDPVVRYAYPPIVAYLLLYCWVLLRRPESVVAFSRVTLVLFEVIWIAGMAWTLAVAGGGAEDLDEAWTGLFPFFFLSMVIFVIVGYLFLSAKAGLLHAGAVVLAVLGAGVAALTGVPDGTGLMPAVLRYCIYLAVIALLLFVLSQAKVRLALAVAAAHRATAEVLEMRDMAYLDPLTAVANRRRLIEELSFQSSRVRPDHPVAVVYFDLDRFKAVNDTYGHAMGDEVLCRVAAVATGMLRREDVVGRLGGEEFVVVAPGTSRPDALALAERLREALPRDVGSALGVQVTASFGVSMLRPGESASAALDRVDGLMYDAKAGGRDRVVSSAG